MEVPNSKVGRDTLEYKIYGMDGIPQEFILQRLQKKRQKMEELSQKEDISEEITNDQPQILQQPIGFLPPNFIMPQFPINFMIPPQPMMIPNQQQQQQIPFNFQNPFQNFIQSPTSTTSMNQNLMQSPTTETETTTNVVKENVKELEKEEEKKTKETKVNLSQSKVILHYNDDEISMEEKRSMLKQYQI